MIFLDILLGMIVGFILGLIPGFHINVLAYLLVSIGAFIIFPNNFYFFFSLAISMTITSIVPLLLFNIPTADNFSLNLGQCKSQDALPHIFGFLFGAIFAVLLLPFFYFLFILFSDFYLLIFLILFFVLVYLVLSDSNRVLAFVIVVLAGLLGVTTLKYNFFFSEPLLPCIFGLFALPTLLVYLLDVIGAKSDSPAVQEIMTFSPVVFTSFLGSIFSSIIAIIPSLSPGMAQTVPVVFAEKFSENNKRIILSSTLVSVILIYFFMAGVFNKSRIGFVSILLENKVISSFLLPDVILLCFVFLLVVSGSCFLLYYSFPRIYKYILKFPRKVTIISVIVFSTILIIFVTNIFSVFLIVLSFSIGLLPIVYNKNKLLLMSYLIVPTILFFV